MKAFDDKVSIKRDNSVSEIIGTMLIFGMVVTAFTAIAVWYVPTTGIAYDQQYQTSSAQAFSSLASDLENPSLSTGSTINVNMPTGIPGGLMIPSQSTSLTYSPNSNYSVSMSYQVDVGYKYLEQLPSAAVSNKIIGTYPRATNTGPSASVTALGNIYITNFNSNTVSVISETTMHLIKTVYAGKQPDAITFDWKNSMLYVADYYGYTLSNGYNYSTITEINATNNSYAGTINSNGADYYLYGPTSIVYDPVANSIFSSNYDPLYSYTTLTQYNLSTSSLSDIYSYYFFSFPAYNPIFQGIAYDYELNELVLTDSSNNGYWLFNPGQNTAKFQPSPNQYYSLYTVELSNTTANTALFASTNSGYVLAYNLITGNEIGYPLQIPNNGAPQNITYSIANDRWYVGVTGAVDQVDVISVSVTSGVSLVGSINVGLNPYNVGIIKDGMFVDYVYSVNFGSNNESVINPSSNNVVYTVWNNYLNSPTSAAYDPVNGFIYVTNGASNNVTIIQSSDNKIIGYVDVGIDPVSAVYDPVNEHIYVANHISNNVSIIGNTTIYKSIPLGKSPPAHPLELVYDSLNEHVYVADNTPKNITIISNTSIFSSISLGHSSHPVAIVYDSSNDHIYVANKKTITVISNATIYKTGTFDGNISVGSNPDSMAYDSLNSTILVSHSPPGNNVTVISGTHTFGNFSLLGTEPYSMTFDEGNSYLYIANEGSDNISLFDTTSWNYVNSMGTPSNPDYILYDPENGYLYALSQGQDQLFIIDGGSAFVSGHVGQQVSGAYSGSGTITGTGNTAFTSGKVFELEDGNLIESYVGTNITKSLGIIPFSVLNLSGRVYVTSSLFNITGLPQSISSYGTNVLVLRYNNIVRNDYYVGEFIDVADVYGNIYPAVVTNVTLSNLTYSIHSPNVLSWNESFFQKYGNPLSQTKNPDSNVWDFSNGMFKVKVSGDTMTIYLNKQSELYSIALDYYQIGLISI